MCPCNLKCSNIFALMPFVLTTLAQATIAPAALALTTFAPALHVNRTFGVATFFIIAFFSTTLVIAYLAIVPFGIKTF